MYHAESTAYQQLLNTTGSSHNLTALSPEEVESDDDIERNIVPRRPGPPSTPRQTTAAAVAAAAGGGDAQTDNEIPRQPNAPLPSVTAASNSAKNTDNKEKRFVSVSVSTSM